MEEKLIKRIITRGINKDTEFYNDDPCVEHIFVFNDGSQLNISKMNTIDIARYAYDNRETDNYKILDFVKDSQKIQSYTTLLSIYLMLELKANINSFVNQNHPIYYIIDRLGGKEMLEELRQEAKERSLLEDREIFWSDIILEKVQNELNSSLK